MRAKRGTQRRPGVRLSGGEHGGRVLSVAGDVRPTEGRVREALFAIWTPLLPNARFLDLFAGTGAVALEAVGRGAMSAVCVEADRRALAVLERNVRRLGEEGVVEVRRGTLPADLERRAAPAPGEPAGEAPDEVADEVTGEADEAGAGAPGGRFDLVFADPPYRFSDHAGLLAAVAPLLAAGGEVAVEHSARRELPFEVAAPGSGAGRLVRVDVRRYGESALSFYRHGPA